MNIATVFQADRDLVGNPASVTATGGFARAEVWRQMLADVLNCPVNIPNSFESGCLGAITMAMKSLGMIENYEIIKTLVGDISSYQPNQEAVNVYQNYLPLFQQVEGLLTPAYSTIAKLQQQSIHQEVIIMPLLIVLIGVIILIFMIVKLKMNTFVGLVITSFIVGLLLGLPLTKIPQTIETGYI